MCTKLPNEMGCMNKIILTFYIYVYCIAAIGKTGGKSSDHMKSLFLFQDSASNSALIFSLLD